MESKTILTVNELAEYLKISKSLIRNMVRDGEIPYFKIHRRILFKLDLINKWIERK